MEAEELSILISEGSLARWCELFKLVDPYGPYNANFTEFKRKARGYMDQNKQFDTFERLMQRAGSSTIAKEDSHVKNYMKRKDSYNAEVFEPYIAEIQKGVPPEIGLKDFMSLQCSKLIGTLDVLLKPVYSSQVLHPRMSFILDTDFHIKVKFIPDSIAVLNHDGQLLELARSGRVFPEIETRCLHMLLSISAPRLRNLIGLWIHCLISANIRVSEIYEPQYQSVDIKQDVSNLLDKANDGGLYHFLNTADIKPSPKNIIINPDSDDIGQVTFEGKEDVILSLLYNQLIVLKVSAYKKKNDYLPITRPIEKLRNPSELQNPGFFKTDLPVTFLGARSWIEGCQVSETSFHFEILTLLLPLHRSFVFTNNKIGILRIKNEQEITVDSSSTALRDITIKDEWERSFLNPKAFIGRLLKPGFMEGLYYTESHKRIGPDVLVTTDIKDETIRSNDSWGLTGNQTHLCNVATIEVKAISRLVIIIRIAMIYIMANPSHRDGAISKISSLLESAGVAGVEFRKSGIQRIIKYGCVIIDQLLKQMFIADTRVGLLMNMTEVVTFEIKATVPELNQISLQYQEQVRDDPYPHITYLKKHVKISYNTLAGALNSYAYVSGIITKSAQNLLNKKDSEWLTDQTFLLIQNMIQTMDPLMRSRRIMQRVVLKRFISDADMEVVTNCNLQLIEEENLIDKRSILSNLETQIDHKIVITLPNETNLRELGGDIVLNSNYSKHILSSKVIKGGIAYGGDSFSTVFLVHEIVNSKNDETRPVVLKFLDSSRYKLDFDSFFLFSENYLDESGGVRLEFNAKNCIKLALSNFYRELYVYRSVQQSCSSTWHLFLPSLISFGL